MQLWLSGMIELTRARMVAHRLPVVPALRARARLHPLPDLLLEDVAAIRRLAGLRIDAREDVLEDRLLEVRETCRSRRSSFHRMPALPMVNSSFCPPISTSTRSNTSSRSSDSPGTCWKYQASLPSSGLSATRGTGEQPLSPGFAPRLTRIHGLACATPQYVAIEIGIVAAGDPRLAAGAQQIRKSCPTCRRPAVPSRAMVLKFPKLLAGGRIVGADEAALGPILRAARQPLHHLPVDHERPARVAVALSRIGDRGLPDDLAGARVQRVQPRIRGRDEHLVLIDRQAARGPYARVDSGPMRFSQIRSPVRPSSACTVLLVFDEIDDAVVHDAAWAGWRRRRSSPTPTPAADP